jgi:2-methylisocitrate lyase-like PEP mutase family enzyme
MGYDLVIFCVSSTFVAAKSIWELMKTLKNEGTTAGCIKDMIPFDHFNQLIGLPEIRVQERQYSTGRSL